MIRTVIYDFDGAMARTFDLCLTAYREIEPGITKEEFRKRYEGDFWKQSRAKELHDKQTPQVVKKAIGRYNSGLQEISLYQAIANSVVRNNGVFQQHIVTSSSEEGIMRLLARQGVDRYFATVKGFESEGSKTDKFREIFDTFGLDPSEAVFLTDTLGDIIEAKSVGLRTLAASYGFHSKEVLMRGNPDRVIQLPVQFLPALRVM